jgi:hypothetical protein
VSTDFDRAPGKHNLVHRTEGRKRTRKGFDFASIRQQESTTTIKLLESNPPLKFTQAAHRFSGASEPNSPADPKTRASFIVRQGQRSPAAVGKCQ